MPYQMILGKSGWRSPVPHLSDLSGTLSVYTSTGLEYFCIIFLTYHLPKVETWSYAEGVTATTLLYVYMHNFFRPVLENYHIHTNELKKMQCKYIL